MLKPRKTYDVFISHSMSDAPFAMEIANACRGSGLETIAPNDLQTETNVSDAIWEALAESRAILMILSPSGPTPSMAIELGAARAWSKPIFAVTPDPASARLPASLAGTPLYSIGRIEDVITAIKASGEQLTDEDRNVLANLYAGSEVAVDQLALEPMSLEELVQKFRSITGKAVSGERLLSEMLRMRKQGRLRRTYSHTLARRQKRLV